MHRNNPDSLVFFVWYFPTVRCYFSNYRSYYNNNYSKTSGALWQQHRDEPSLTGAGAIANSHAANNSASFIFKQK